MTEQSTSAKAQTEIEAIEHDLRESHKRATPGTWGKGSTTHETVSTTGGKRLYHIASFHHADDAWFCDLAHAHVPRLLSELSTLRARVADFEHERKALNYEIERHVEARSASSARIAELEAKAQGAPEGYALVPKRPTAAMEKIFMEEGWEWWEVLAAAEAITEGEHAALAAAPPPAVPAPDARDAIQQLLDVHAAELERNSYAYFELAHTRQTGWCAWITDHPRSMPVAPVVNPDRNVIAMGQGETPQEACAAALAAQAKGAQA